MESQQNCIAKERRECERMNVGPGRGAILLGSLIVNLHLQASRILECFK